MRMTTKEWYVVCWTRQMKCLIMRYQKGSDFLLGGDLHNFVKRHRQINVFGNLNRQGE